MRRVTNTNILFRVNQILNRGLPPRKNSIKAPAKFKTCVYVLAEICLQWSKWLCPKLSNDKSYTTSSLFENPIAINETGKENDKKYYYRYLFDHEKKDLKLPKNYICEPPYDTSSLGNRFDKYNELIQKKEQFELFLQEDLRSQLSRQKGKLT